MRKKPTRKMALRSHIAFALLSVFMLVLIANLFRIQILKGDEYRLKAERNQMKDKIINAERGTIYDSNMKVIAKSASAWLVYVNPSRVTSEEQKTLLIDKFTELFDLDREIVTKKLNKSESGYEKIIGEIDNDKKQELQKFISENKEHKLNEVVGIDPDTKRYYPLSNFASTVIGFTGYNDEGRAGLELQYNNELTGESGRIITAQNALAGDMPNNYSTKFDAKQGYSLMLTVDEVIQYYLEQQLRQAIADTQAKNAYGIVMDVKTGAVLAMSTVPDYNLNEPYKIASSSVLEKIEEIEDEAERNKAKRDAQFAQWRNRVISDSYEPGSVFKVFVAAAALEEGVITPDFTYNCQSTIKVANRTQHCFHYHKHGVQTVAEALPNSCNTFFITVGQRMGKETFMKYFEAFGFTEKTGIDLPSEAVPVADRTYHSLKSMGIVELSSSSFGQSFQVTPIQVITGVSCIANGGKLMEPYLVSKVLDENGNIVKEREPIMKRQVISQKTASLMAEYMEGVCEWGTGKNAFVPGYHVCGKTGTSEKLNPGRENENIASFAGFAPANDPRIAILIIVDDPQGNTGGGIVAAPIAGRLFSNVLEYLNVDPQFSETEIAQTTVKAPNLIGEKIDTVKSKAAGFTVKIVGDGEEVIAQSPAVKQAMPKNGVIVVYTNEGAPKSTATVPNLEGLNVADANRMATNAGFNIKISGATQNKGEVVSYKQSIAAGESAEQGTVITVYFKSGGQIFD